jgi:hypothetical protein
MYFSRAEYVGMRSYVNNFFCDDGRHTPRYDKVYVLLG